MFVNWLYVFLANTYYKWIITADCKGIMWPADTFLAA